MCSQYHLEAMIGRSPGASVARSKEWSRLPIPSLKGTTGNHVHSCLEEMEESFPVLCERSPFFLGEMEEHARRPFREQNPLRSRESPKSVLSCGKIFFVRNMEGGFLTGSESLCGKSQGESPSKEHPPHFFSEGIKESCA